VDGASRVGAWTDLSLDKAGNPWIAYQDLSRHDNTDGLKIAYKDASRFAKTAWDPHNLDVNGNPTVQVTGWEALTVPTGAGHFVMEDRLSIEANTTVDNASPGGTWPNVNWSAAVAYLSTDLYRLAYYVKPPVP
jgi:hypothetical protein